MLIVALVVGVFFALSGAPTALADGPITADGTPVTASFTSTVRSQTYTFSATQGQRVSLKISNSNVTSSSLVIKNPDGSNIHSSGAFSSSYFSGVVTLNSPGTATYSIVITAASTYVGNMTVRLYTINDQTGSLNFTSSGTTANVSISAPGQNAGFTFEANAGDIFFLDSAGSVCAWTAYYVFFPSGLSLFHNESLQPTPWWAFHGWIDRALLPETGTYTIVFDPDSYACADWTGTAQFSIWKVPADVSGSITVGGPAVSRTLTTPGQRAVLSFHAAGGWPLRLCVSPAGYYDVADVTDELGYVVFHGAGWDINGCRNFTTSIGGEFTLLHDVHRTDTGTYSWTLSSNGMPMGNLYGLASLHGMNPSAWISEPVNTLTGAFSLQEVDLSLPGVGVPFKFARSYTSVGGLASSMGPGWMHDYDVRILPAGSSGDVSLRGEGGQVLFFSSNGDGSYSSPTATSALTDQSGGGWKLIRRDQVSYSFNANGQLTSEVDRNGTGLTFGYDGSGNMTQITDSAGRVITLTYNASNLLTSLNAPDGRHVDYGYTSGVLTSVTDVRGKVWTYAYDAAGRLASELNPNGNYGFRNTYDTTSGRVTSTRDALDNQTTFAWNSSTATTTTTDPAGKQWKDIYANNKLSKRIDPLGDTNTYTFDSRGNQTQIIDGRGNTTTMTYDASGNLLTRTGPAPSSLTETWTYNAKNDPLTYKDRRGNTTSYGYDTAGNLTSVTKPGNLTTDYTRNTGTPQLVTAITDPRNKQTSYGYDSATDLLTSVTTPAGNQTSYDYDAAGRVTAITDPRGNVQGADPADFTTNLSYDAAGHLLTRTDALGNQTSYGYDNVGLLSTVTNSNNKVWTYDYNAANDRTKETAPDASSITAEYDSRGNLTKTTSAKGAITTYAYDDANRLLTKISPRGNVSGADPNLFTWRYGYDGNGNRVSSTDPLGNAINYTYDELDRLTKSVAPDNNSNYGPQTLSLNPAAYWRLGETSGATATDSSPNGLNASYIGSPTPGLSGAIAGNTAVGFNGSSQYIEAPYSAALNPATFSVEVWVYMTGGQGTYRAVVSSRNYTGSSGSGYTIYATPSNTWQFWLGNGSASFVMIGGPAVVLNKWTQLVGTYDGTTGRLYVDGTLAASAAVSFVPNASRPLRLAAGTPESTPSYYLPGRVDDAAVFSTALSATQISAQIQEQQRGVRTTSYAYDGNDNIVSAIDPLGSVTGYSYDTAGRNTSQLAFGVAPTAYWRLDEGAGATAGYDVGGLGKKLTYSTATLGVQGATSDGDSAASFSGATGSRATNPSVVSSATSALTMEAWIYPTASNQRGTIFYNGNINANGYGLMMMGAAGAAGNTLTVMAPGTSWDVLNNASARTLPINQWTFAAVTRDTTGTWRLYLNGNPTPVATGTANPIAAGVTGGAGTWIGGATGSSGTNYYFQGRVDEPAFFPLALTGAQIQQQANGSLIRVTSYTYDADSNLTKAIEPLGNTTIYDYSDDNQLQTVTDPLGNVGGSTPSEHQISYAYDAAGNKISETDQLGHVTDYSYNRVGQLASITDANDHATSYEYDELGQLASVTDALNKTTSYLYDDVGNLTSRTDPKLHTTSYTYNAAHELTRTTNPLGRLWNYSYDAAGNLITKVDAKANAAQDPSLGTTSYSYDNRERLASVDYSDATPTVDYAYDAFGNPISISDGAGTQTYVYAGDDQPLTVKRGNNTYTYSYGAFGELLSRTYPDSTVLNYSFDADGRMTAASAASQTTSYNYDDASRLTTTALPNGFTETRSYDNAGWLSNLANARNGTTLSQFTFTRDAVGNPTQIAASAGTERYDYDALDHVTEGCSQVSPCSGANDPFIRWTYDPVGNRSSEERPTGTTNYNYNAGDELTQAGSTSYSYDANGNETAAGANSFSWNAAGQLTSLSDGTSTTTFAYDGDGNRLSANDGSSTTNYSWDINNPLPQLASERDGSGNLVRRYSYGLERISLTTPADTSYYHYDGRGDVANLTSPTGASQWTYAYEPFGTANATQDDPSAPSNPIQFAGEYQDTVTGTYNLRARHYDPDSGRMLATDPLTPLPTDPYLSAYTYADQNPLTGTDPSGLDACSRVFGKTVCKYTHKAGDIADRVIKKAITTPFTEGYSCVTNFAHGDLRTAGRSCIKALVAALAFTLPGRSIVAIRFITRTELRGLIGREAEIAVESALPAELTIGRNAEQGVSVYRGVSNGQQVYSGITNNLERRAAQHGDRFSRLVDLTESGPVTRGEARAIEQALIVRGVGQNLRNEISPLHPWYQQAVDWGEAWLWRNGVSP